MGMMAAYDNNAGILRAVAANLSSKLGSPPPWEGEGWIRGEARKGAPRSGKPSFMSSPEDIRGPADASKRLEFQFQRLEFQFQPPELQFWWLEFELRRPELKFFRLGFEFLRPEFEFW